MQISKAEKEPLNILLNIKVEKSDYENQVSKTLTDYKKKAKVPGFRPGKVPMSFIKKNYEGQVTYEEINKIVSTSLNEYLTENKINYLGEPLPNVEKTLDLKDDEHEFEFELGLSPELDLELTDVTSAEFKVIKPTEEEVNGHIERLQKQLGTDEETEAVKEGSTITFEITNLENDLFAVLFEDLKSDYKTSLTDKKVGEEFKVNKEDLLENTKVLDEVLKEKEISELELKITKITELIPSEINEDFLTKMFGEDSEVKTEEDFKGKIQEDFEKSYESQSNILFYNDVFDKLIDSKEIPLPKSFLIKWLNTTKQNEGSTPIDDAEFEKMKKGILYELVKSHLIQKNEIQIQSEEMITAAKKHVASQFGIAADNEQFKDILDNMAGRVMKDQNQSRQIAENILNDKLVELFKEKVSFAEVTITSDELKKQFENE